jgi:hypothetical protein
MTPLKIKGFHEEFLIRLLGKEKAAKAIGYGRWCDKRPSHTHYLLCEPTKEVILDPPSAVLSSKCMTLLARNV